MERGVAGPVSESRGLSIRQLIIADSSDNKGNSRIVLL